MDTYLFYTSTKTIKTNFTSTIPDGNVVPLDNYHIWVLYSNGQWILYDLINNKWINSGILTKPTQQQYLIKSPKALDANRILYINCTTLKLECLNPYTGRLDSAWNGDVPSLELLPTTNRGDKVQIHDALFDTKLEVLKDSKTVGVIEIKEPSEYLLSVFQEDKTRVLQISHNSEGKKMEFSKGNETDTFLLWESYQGVEFKFLLFNIDQRDKGFQKITAAGGLDATILDSFPWNSNSVVFFGNPDDSGIPQKFLYNFQTNELSTEAISDTTVGRAGILTRVMCVDPKKQQLLFSEVFDTPSMVLYNLKSKKANFSKKLERNESSVAVDPTGRYFISYKGVRCGEAFSESDGETVLQVNNFTNKRMTVLHLMKNAKLKNGQSYMEYYGDTYVVKHVADMLG